MASCPHQYARCAGEGRVDARNGVPVVDDAVELADMIAQLRGELSRAMSDGDGDNLRFGRSVSNSS